MNKFENTYILLKDSDKTVERIKKIAEKYSKASGYDLERYLKEHKQEPHTAWDNLVADTNSGEITVSTESYNIRDKEQITEEDLDNYLDSEKPSKEDIGCLVESLYMNLSPSNITISVNGNGHILIHGDKIPTVDATKLAAEDITKAYEALVMLEGLFVEID